MASGNELQSEANNISLIATDKPDTIDHTHQSIVSEVSIKSGPFAGQETNRIKLGPFFKPECVKDLLPSLDGFPDTPSLPPFIYTPDDLQCHWTRETSKPIAGWTTCHDSLDWFLRLSSKHDKWRSQRIYEFLKLSTYPILPFDGVLSASLLCCWNACLNVFITGRGTKTVTLEDIAYITGLSPAGLDLPYHKHVTGALDTTQLLFRRSSDNKVVPNLPFSYFTSKYSVSREKEVTREEEVLFINFAICKLLMGPSINVHRTFLPLAANIEVSPEDQPLALGPFLLAQFYRCMFKLRTSSSLVHTGGPLWLLSLWGFLYFPSLVSIKSREEVNEAISEGTSISPSSACSYGEVATLLLSIASGKRVREVLLQLLDSKPLPSSNKTSWHPCSAKDEIDAPLDEFSSWAKIAAPLWLLETSPMMYKSDDSAHWQSILVPRDLLYVGPQSIGAEVYNPNLVARQFGMIQACPVPFYQTLNQPWGTRCEFLLGGSKKNTREELDRKYAIENSVSSRETFNVSSFNVQPWFCSADVDDGFEIWWKDFIKCHRKAKTFIIGQEVILKALSAHQIQSNNPDTAQNLSEKTNAVEVPSSENAVRASMQDGSPFPSHSRRTKKRISASSPQPLKQQGEKKIEKKVTNMEVEEEEEDDAILLCRLKRRKPIRAASNSTSSSTGGSSEDHVLDAPSSNTLPSFEKTMLEEPTTEASIAETFEVPVTIKSKSKDTSLENSSFKSPNNNINLTTDLQNTSRPTDVTPSNSVQPEDEEAPDSVKACGKLSARIEYVLKTLSHTPSPRKSLLETKKASLLDTLEQLVKDPTSFEEFTSLMVQAQEFAELAPASFQSTMDHFKKSIGSIKELSSNLKDHGPKILSSLEKKPELTSSMEQLKLEVEKKVEGVNTLQKTHISLCTRIQALETELIQLRGEQAAIEEQLAVADNELSSLSCQLDASITTLEGEAALLATAESMRTNWDQDMKVFKSAIVGIIEQLRSL